MANQEINAVVLPLAERLATAMNYMFVDAELVKEGPGYYLRIYIDKPGGITLDDCEQYHRAIQLQLENVAYDFLEICSPGLDRPLKNATDYVRNVGSRIEVRLYKPQQGGKLHTGILIGLEDDVVTLDTSSGRKAFDWKNIARAKPIIVFEDKEEE